MSSSSTKPHVLTYTVYILDEVQESRTETVVEPTKYFRDVATVVQVSGLCDVNFMFSLEKGREEWQNRPPHVEKKKIHINTDTHRGRKAVDTSISLLTLTLCPPSLYGVKLAFVKSPTLNRLIHREEEQTECLRQETQSMRKGELNQEQRQVAGEKEMRVGFFCVCSWVLPVFMRPCSSECVHLIKTLIKPQATSFSFLSVQSSSSCLFLTSILFKDLLGGTYVVIKKNISYNNAITKNKTSKKRTSANYMCKWKTSYVQIYQDNRRDIRLNEWIVISLFTFF